MSIRLVPLLASALLTSIVVDATASPESESLKISKNLRGVTDQEWGQVAGEKESEYYNIRKGDTLYDISGRLFGDPRYWPKVWEINNEGILNPHMIRPKQSITFLPGSGNSLPSIEIDGEESGEINGGESKSGPPKLGSVMSDKTSSLVAQNTIHADDHAGATWDEKTPKPSGEWKRLPRQSWEPVQSGLPDGSDKNGFDSNSKVKIRRSTGFDLESVVACQQIEPLATITGGRNSNKFLSLGDEITLQPGIVQLETNQTYAIYADPLKLTGDEGRTAFSYPVQGQVKIIGVNDGQYLGEITSLQGVTQRGQMVVNKPPHIQRLDPIPGPSPVLGKIMLDSRISTYMTAQYKWVFIDRGTADGVQPGMVFRIFQYKDPSNDQQLTSSNMLVYGDVEIYQNCENFSVGQIVWAKGEIMDNTPAILMTDVEDYYTRYYMNGEAAPREVTPLPVETPQVPTDPDLDIEQTQPAPTPSPDDGLSLDSDSSAAPAVEPSPTPSSVPPVEKDDWLDKLDNGQDLVPEEEKELEQLEKYDENKPEVLPALEPDTAPSSDFIDENPGTQLPPPPSAELKDPPPPAGADPLLPPPPAETNSDFIGDDLAPVEVPKTISPSPNPQVSATPSPSPSAGKEDLLSL